MKNREYLENYLKKLNIYYEFIELSDALTSNKASENSGISLEDIGKTMVNGRYIFLLKYIAYKRNMLKGGRKKLLNMIN